MIPKLYKLMQKCYTIAETEPEGARKWLVEFAGECLEVAQFENDDKDPERLILTLLQEFMAEYQLNKSEPVEE